jgi:hypothetical protein
MRVIRKIPHYGIPYYGYVGIVLIIIFWYLNWSVKGVRTHWGFFFLWLGYSLFIDALVFLRKGSSMIHRNWRKYFLLFLISAPCWWLFELFNIRLGNWIYVGKEHFSNWEYFLWASLSFSTVMPAVFGSAEFASTFNWLKRSNIKLNLRPKKKVLVICSLLGILSLSLLLIWPQYFFYLVWVSVFCIVDPVNYIFKNGSIFDYSPEKMSKAILSLCLGVLICAFFWEMWNFYSYPKWVYHLPFADFFHIFEMPFAGYIGYLPFSMELYALYNLINASLCSKTHKDFIQLV